MWKKSVFAVFLGSAFLVGCNTGGEKTVDNNNESTYELIDDVNEDIDIDGTYNNENDINKGTNSTGGREEDTYKDASQNNNHDMKKE